MYIYVYFCHNSLFLSKTHYIACASTRMCVCMLCVWGGGQRSPMRQPQRSPGQPQSSTETVPTKPASPARVSSQPKELVAVTILDVNECRCQAWSGGGGCWLCMKRRVSRPSRCPPISTDTRPKCWSRRRRETDGRAGWRLGKPTRMVSSRVASYLQFFLMEFVLMKSA
jgi:hypothetical protein